MPPGSGQAALPNPEQLKQRVIANEKKSATQKEKYLCDVAEESAQLNADGSVKQQESKTYERFFVHGREIDRLLAKNGKPLSAAEERKEQERAAEKIKKYSDPHQIEKAEDRMQKQIDMALEALRYSDGRRDLRNGRNTISYALSGDPKFHPGNLEQRFAKALLGRISVDEETGELVELRVHTAEDVKIAGGLLANLHKGFELHIQQNRQPDGIWLINQVEGRGDARAGLFFHPRFRFKQNVSHCRLYTVDATSGNTRPVEPEAK
jgi:hypothetical protein